MTVNTDGPADRVDVDTFAEDMRELNRPEQGGRDWDLDTSLHFPIDEPAESTPATFRELLDATIVAVRYEEQLLDGGSVYAWRAAKTDRVRKLAELHRRLDKIEDVFTGDEVRRILDGAR